MQNLDQEQSRQSGVPQSLVPLNLFIQMWPFDGGKVYAGLIRSEAERFVWTLRPFAFQQRMKVGQDTIAPIEGFGYALIE